jgi:hypothetical protein
MLHAGRIMPYSQILDFPKPNAPAYFARQYVTKKKEKFYNVDSGLKYIYSSSTSFGLIEKTILFNEKRR